MLPGVFERRGCDRAGVASAVAEPRLTWRDQAARLAVVATLLAAPVAGWLFASRIDPEGWLLRVTLGWLIAEFR